MIKIAIIDDEPLAAQLLKSYVGRLDGFELLGVFNDPVLAFSTLRNSGVQLIFIDVQMPEITGLQFIKLADPSWQFILTTAFEEHAVRGFELDAIDYLLKPISFERFSKSCERAKDRLEKTGSPSQAAQPAEAPESIFVKSGFKTLRIAIDEIRYLEGLGDYIAIHLKNEKILTLQRLSEFEALLPSARFMRIHRSYIVNLEKIDFIERNRIVLGDVYLPLSAGYKEEFHKRIGQ